MADIFRNPKRAFNRIYRDNRIAAKQKGEPFQPYSQAKDRFVRAVQEVRIKSAYDPAEFWHQVFSFPPKKS